MNLNACEIFQDRLLDLLEGELEPNEAAQVRTHLETCTFCQEYYAWLVNASADLKSFGDALVASAPPIDLVEAVLQSVEEADRHPVIPIRRRRPVSWRFAAGLAAAAAVAVFVWFKADGRFGGDLSGNAPNQDRIIAKAPNKPVKPTPKSLKTLETSRELLAKLEPVGRSKAAPPRAMEATAPPDLRPISFDDVVRTRQKAGGDENARAQLVRWASLTPEEARKLVRRGDLSVSTIVGAAESLDSKEAATALLTAVGRYPDSSFLRFEAASKLAEQNRTASGVGIEAGTESETPPVINPPAPKPPQPDPATVMTLEQIQAWKNLDPNNALPYYLEADMLLRNGDPAAALEALRQAQQLGTANVYALESAQARQEALTAGGMEADTARLLTALTAGNNEYNFLYTLSNDLLEYGRSYAEQNSLPEAQQIYESVGRLGEQVASGATFSLVESAGLYAQQQSLLGLEQVYAALGSEEAIAQFQNQTLELLTQIDELNRYVTELNNLFASSVTDIWNAMAEAILQGGDLNLSDYLSPPGG